MNRIQDLNEGIAQLDRQQERAENTIENLRGQIREIEEQISGRKSGRANLLSELHRVRREEAAKNADLDLSQYKTKAGAAKALYNHLRETFGNSPDIVLLSPYRSEELGYGRVWRVMWESGPSEWGITLSMSKTWSGVTGHLDNRNFYLEPYHSFDVGFCN